MSLAAIQDTSVEAVTAAIRNHAHAIRGRGVTALFLYGSRARRDNRPDSDLDIYVEYDRDSTFSLVALAGIKDLIEAVTGLAVHVTTANSIPEASRTRITREAVQVL